MGVFDANWPVKDTGSICWDSWVEARFILEAEEGGVFWLDILVVKHVQIEVECCLLKLVFISIFSSLWHGRHRLRNTLNQPHKQHSHS